MKKIFITIIPSILFCLCFLGCKNVDDKKDTNIIEILKNNLPEEVAVKTLCFRNEYPFKDNPKLIDIQELNITIDDENVTGTYNWLPAQKDKRTGTFEGKIDGDRITAIYTFWQEGIKNSAPIIITLLENQVTIKSEETALGLDATMQKTACNESKSVKNKDATFAPSYTDSLVVYKTNDLIIQKLSEHVYEHISFLETNDYEKVASNGMIVINGNEAVIFDTPTNDNNAKELINYISKKRNLKIIAVIPTHFHEDCVGGLNAFITHSIPVFASYKTIELLSKKEKGYTKSLKGFDKKLTLAIGSKKVYANYYGEGHTKDNIVGYFPDDKAVFGGCLIKEIGATKGNLDDANINEWSKTVRSVKREYPDAKIVIPGHGKWGQTELFDYTIKLFE